MHYENIFIPEDQQSKVMVAFIAGGEVITLTPLSPVNCAHFPHIFAWFLKLDLQWWPVKVELLLCIIGSLVKDTILKAVELAYFKTPQATHNFSGKVRCGFEITGSTHQVKSSNKPFYFVRPPQPIDSSSSQYTTKRILHIPTVS
jgi:hypothetical protein